MPARGKRAGALWPLVAGIVVALLAGLVLTVTHRPSRLIVAPSVAVRAALHDPQTKRVLAGSHWNHVTVSSLDDQLENVTFLPTGQLVESVTVDRSLTVRPQENGRTQKVSYGNWVAYEPAVLGALAALFVLMVGVTPWWRLRNLDVAACLTLVSPVVLRQHRYIAAGVLAALPGLVYLLARCSAAAFGRGPGTGAATPAMPLLSAIAPGLDPVRRVRWLRGLLGVLALVFVMVGVGSPNAVDVICAVMEGATRLVHGVLPYGHLPPGVVHGDTYPILSYALYVPVALLAPVNNGWDSVDAGLAVAALMAFVAAWVIFRAIAGPRSRRGASRRVEDEEAGLRIALAWLAFPPLLVTAFNRDDGRDAGRRRGAVAPSDRLLEHARGGRVVQARPVRAAADLPGPAAR